MTTRMAFKENIEKERMNNSIDFLDYIINKRSNFHREYY